MSNVLKKITKKYKWLRFLNYKTTKLAVLSAALFGLCLSSGHSFAKYRDENYGNGNAGAAKFDYGIVTYDPVTLKQPDENTDIEGGIHCFIASFKLTINESEVKTSYSLKLRIVNPSFDIADFNTGESGVTQTSFLPKKNEDSFYVFSEDGTTQESKSISNITGQTLTYDPNSWYYAVETKDGNENKYVWESKSSIVNDIIEIDTGIINPGNSIEKNFKLLFFVNAISEQDGSVKTWEAENSKIIYNLVVNQEESKNE